MKILKPPDQLTVSEWADQYRVLPKGSTNLPGRWKTSRRPYLKGIMDAFTDKGVEEIVFVKPTQVGGTECILNILGYIIDQDPGATLLIYPSENMGEDICKNRIQPGIRATKVLANKWLEKESKLLALQFTNMYLPISGANSTTNLSSRPIRYLLLDEVDKYPPRVGKEADPISLARERTKTFSYNKKIFITSTPTLRTGAIWKEFESCTRQLYYYVPCPHCGEYQRLKRTQIRYSSEAKTALQKKDTAFYECEYCRRKIVDADKMRMLQKGEWRSEKDEGKKKLGFSLNAIYSPDLSFGDVAYQWIDAQGDYEKLQNFVNSWLGEPWEQVGSTAGEEKVLSKQSRYTQGIVPEGTALITAGVDVQRTGLYYTVRAWGKEKVSWNIDHGFLPGLDFAALMGVLNQGYHDEKGKEYYTALALIDSGDQTDTVYDFCYIYQPFTLPVKGVDRNGTRPYQVSTVEKSSAKGMNLILCDGSFYKNMIYGNLNMSEGGKWFVYDGVDPEYCRQLTSEHKIFERKGNSERWVWKKKTSDADNHYLDCEVYAACAADLMGVADLLETQEETETPVSQYTAGEESEESWLPDGDWIPGEGDWI